jgi:hypothetical protein
VPLVDESGKLAGMGQLVGGRHPAADRLAPGVSVSPAHAAESLNVSLQRPRTPQRALSPDRRAHPAPAVPPPSGPAPYSAMVPVPLDSGLRDRDWEPGEHRRMVPPRASGVITPQSALSNTAYEMAELRERESDRRAALPASDHGPRAPHLADQDERRRSLSDGNPWTRVPDLATARRELQQLYHDTGDRRAVEASRAIEAMLSSRQRAPARTGELECKFCHKEIKRETIMGPPPEYCDRSCESRMYRQRKREQQAAEAKVGPSPVTTDPEPWDST